MQVTQSRIQRGELEALIAHSVPEATEGLGNVVLFGVTQQRHITTEMAAYPATDCLTEAKLQHGNLLPSPGRTSKYSLAGGRQLHIRRMTGFSDRIAHKGDPVI